MKKESLDDLGFKKMTKEEEEARYEVLHRIREEKEKKGFVAGVNVRPAHGILPKSRNAAWW
jgi:isopenicillin N synthase-like dioxygenase